MLHESKIKCRRCGEEIIMTISDENNTEKRKLSGLHRIDITIPAPDLEITIDKL